MRQAANQCAEWSATHPWSRDQMLDARKDCLIFKCLRLTYGIHFVIIRIMFTAIRNQGIFSGAAAGTLYLLLLLRSRDNRWCGHQTG